MKETGPTGRAEEIVESKIESWIPISYAVRHKGRHSSLPLPSALPLVPPPAAASRIHHVSCTPQPEPPSPAQRALCPLSPPSSRALQFRDHTDGAAGGGRARRWRQRRQSRWFIFSVGGGGGDEGDCDWREHRRLTRLVPHFAPTSRVGVGWLWRTSMIMMMICMQCAGGRMPP